MNTTNLIQRNLIWYRRVNLAVILGVATAVAVLAGALLVGHSVRRSLRELALSRLGRADRMIIGPGFFRAGLVTEIEAAPLFRAEFADAAALIALTGVATRDENRSRAGEVQVYGIDQSFESFHGVKIGALEPGEALISPGRRRSWGHSRERCWRCRLKCPPPSRSSRSTGGGTRPGERSG